MFMTKNGVKVTFDNNNIRLKENAPPLLVTDKDGNLIEVNFDGYEIKPKG